jgi:hypothetical protein
MPPFYEHGFYFIMTKYANAAPYGIYCAFLRFVLKAYVQIFISYTKTRAQIEAGG